MTGIASLLGRRVLVVEDEVLIAMDIGQAIEDAGGLVVGPAMDVSSARWLAETGKIHAALLGYWLNTVSTGSVVETLASRGVPFVFYTGHSRGELSQAWPDALILPKPSAGADVVSALVAALGGEGPSE